MGRVTNGDQAHTVGGCGLKEVLMARSYNMSHKNSCINQTMQLVMKGSLELDLALEAGAGEEMRSGVALLGSFAITQIHYKGVCSSKGLLYFIRYDNSHNLEYCLLSIV